MARKIGDDHLGPPLTTWTILTTLTRPAPTMERRVSGRSNVRAFRHELALNLIDGGFECVHCLWMRELEAFVNGPSSPLLPLGGLWRRVVFVQVQE